ncbi:MAG: hypothetical protein IIY77_05385, partial [Lachnospiraceae bacterium]|nr:hypothetical protein [Lachnospiraceae bacterium]
NLVPLFSLRAFISAKRNSEILSGLKDKILEESVSLRYVCGRGYIREEYLHDLCIYLLNDASSEDSILYQPEKLAALLKAGSSLEKEDPSGGEDDFVNIHLGKELLFNTYGHYTFPMGRFLNQYRLASGFFNPEDFKEDWFTKAGYDNITDVVNGWSEPVELTGFPLGETGAFSVQNSLSLGILKGKNTEDSWKFLKSTLEDKFQEGNRTYMYETIPVNRAVYYGLLERITENNQLDPLYLFMSGSGLYDHSGSALAPAPLLTEEMLKAVEMNINECRYIAEADPFVKQIVAEEAERFYEGSYDALSAAERIGERVRLYRSEQEY